MGTPNQYPLLWLRPVFHSFQNVPRHTVNILGSSTLLTHWSMLLKTTMDPASTHMSKNEVNYSPDPSFWVMLMNIWVMSMNLKIFNVYSDMDMISKRTRNGPNLVNRMRLNSGRHWHRVKLVSLPRIGITLWYTSDCQFHVSSHTTSQKFNWKPYFTGIPVVVRTEQC